MWDFWDSVPLAILVYRDFLDNFLLSLCGIFWDSVPLVILVYRDWFDNELQYSLCVRFFETVYLLSSWYIDLCTVFYFVWDFQDSVPQVILVYRDCSGNVLFSLCGFLGQCTTSHLGI